MSGTQEYVPVPPGWNGPDNLVGSTFQKGQLVVFKRMMRAMGVGGPSVETIIPAGADA